MKMILNKPRYLIVHVAQSPESGQVQLDPEAQKIPPVQSLWTSQICFHLTVSLEAYLQCWECHVHTLTVISPKEYSVPLSSHSYVHPRRWDSALDQLQLHVHLGAADM